MVEPGWTARFWPKVERRNDNECWPWKAALNEGGYGRLLVDGKMERSHRLAYTLLVGPIPEGLVIDHLCRNRACCNPSHMEPVSNAENVARGTVRQRLSAKYAAITHCKRGHAYAENSFRNKRGARVCKLCKAHVAKERNQRLTEERRARPGPTVWERQSAKWAAVTHCKRGHSFEDNSVRRPNGCRRCKPCAALNQRERNARLRNLKKEAS